jgi:hypothetical protein
VLWATSFVLVGGVRTDAIATAAVGWLALSALVACVAIFPRWQALALGLAAGTTPLCAVLAPLVLVSWALRLGRRQLLQSLLVSAAVAGAILLPFLLWDRHPFIEGTLLWFNDLDNFPRLKWRQSRTWIRFSGLSGYFWEHGLEVWLKRVQMLALLATTLLHFLGLRKIASRAEGPAPDVLIAVHGAAAFLLFMVVNPVLWPYFFHPALMMALVAAAVLTAETRGGVQAERPR